MPSSKDPKQMKDCKHQFQNILSFLVNAKINVESCIKEQSHVGRGLPVLNLRSVSGKIDPNINESENAVHTDAIPLLKETHLVTRTPSDKSDWDISFNNISDLSGSDEKTTQLHPNNSSYDQLLRPDQLLPSDPHVNLSHFHFR